MASLHLLRLSFNLTYRGIVWKTITLLALPGKIICHKIGRRHDTANAVQQLMLSAQNRKVRKTTNIKKEKMRAHTRETVMMK